MPESDLTVRRRRADDVGELLVLLGLTQRETGYPVDPAAVRSDWLADARELGAWVAERDGHPVAHVALHRAAGLSVPVWREATGRGDEELVVVSRLFSRARGAGSILLAAAVRSARRLGRQPVLEVQHDSAAHAFYLRRGWMLAGEVQQQWGGRPTRVVALVLVP